MWEAPGDRVDGDRLGGDSELVCKCILLDGVDMRASRRTNRQEMDRRCLFCSDIKSPELARIVELTRVQPEYCEAEGHKLVHRRLFQEGALGGARICIPED